MEENIGLRNGGEVRHEPGSQHAWCMKSDEESREKVDMRLRAYSAYCLFTSITYVPNMPWWACVL